MAIRLSERRLYKEVGSFFAQLVECVQSATTLKKTPLCFKVLSEIPFSNNSHALNKIVTLPFLVTPKFVFFWFGSNFVFVCPSI